LPEIVHCGKCRKAIKVKDFPDQMRKLRRHYKKYHPEAFEKSIKKGIKTRKGKK
jgi:hypothetical protein